MRGGVKNLPLIALIVALAAWQEIRLRQSELQVEAQISSATDQNDRRWRNLVLNRRAFFTAFNDLGEALDNELKAQAAFRASVTLTLDQIAKAAETRANFSDKMAEIRAKISEADSKYLAKSGELNFTALSSDLRC